MKRRTFMRLAAGAGFFLPRAAIAQQSKRLPLVAFVVAAASPGEITGPDPATPVVRAFVHGLRDLGWIDGRTIIIERHTAQGDPGRARAIIAEVVRNDVDVIMLASARWLHDAAQNATRTIPTVASFADDPVAAGLIASLSRPGGNLTGVTLTTGPEFQVKRLQLLTEVAPHISRAAFLGTRDVVEQLRGVADQVGFTIILVPVDAADQYEVAFAAIRAARADAMLVATGPLNRIHAARIVAFALDNRLPTMHANREAVDAGGLIFYGASDLGRFRQAAHFVDRILKGAKPSDLPVEQPTTFELVINSKTVRALGLSVPPSLLARADEVVD